MTLLRHLLACCLTRLLSTRSLVPSLPLAIVFCATGSRTYGVVATLRAVRTYRKEHGEAIGADAYWPLLDAHYAALLVRYREEVFDAKTLRVVLSELLDVDVPLSLTKQTLAISQCDVELTNGFTFSALHAIPRKKEVRTAPIIFGVCSWTFCPTCGLRQPRRHVGAIHGDFHPPMTLHCKCSVKHGCAYDSLRLLDLETNGAKGIIDTSARHTHFWVTRRREIPHLF